MLYISCQNNAPLCLKCRMFLAGFLHCDQLFVFWVLFFQLVFFFLVLWLPHANRVNCWLWFDLRFEMSVDGYVLLPLPLTQHNKKRPCRRVTMFAVIFCFYNCTVIEIMSSKNTLEWGLTCDIIGNLFINYISSLGKNLDGKKKMER